jgi:[ribosomal protein S5]-alanine N-acetyltransferase
MRLTTKRLILRPPTPKDIPDVVKNINNLNVSRWLTVVPYPYKNKDARKWIEKQKEKSKKKLRDSYQFSIEIKSERIIIGGIGIHNIDKTQDTATIGYWLGEKYWRQGYGSEALRAILDLAFNKLKLRRLEAEIYKNNPSSGKLLKKYGFKKEGIKRKKVKALSTGMIHDAIIYALLREEYEPRKR